MKGAKRSEYFDGYKMATNILIEGEGGADYRLDMDEICKFFFVGCSQFRPLMEILQGESGDSFTRK